MSVTIQLDNLNSKERQKVCDTTVYNLIGYFSGRAYSQTITKEAFEGLVNANIKDLNKKKSGEGMEQERFEFDDDDLLEFICQGDLEDVRKAIRNY